MYKISDNMRPFITSWYLVLYLWMSMGYDIPNFNFSILSRHNESGSWYADVQLAHEEKHAWDVYVDHKTTFWNGSKAIVIDAKIVSSIPAEEGLQNVERKMSIKCLPATTCGYTLSHYGYYKTYNWKNTTWHKAVEVCEEEGGYLLVTKSLNETHEIVPFIKKLWNIWFYVGIHDEYKEGEYVTVHNDTLQSTGFPWWPGEPDGRSIWNCGCFNYESTSKFGLSDCSCKAELPFICKKDIIQQN